MAEPQIACTMWNAQHLATTLSLMHKNLCRYRSSALKCSHQTNSDDAGKANNVQVLEDFSQEQWAV